MTIGLFPDGFAKMGFYFILSSNITRFYQTFFTPGTISFTLENSENNKHDYPYFYFVHSASER